MTGGKIEYPALTAISAAAVNRLAALSGGEENLLVRLRDPEILSVGFVLGNGEKLAV